MLVGSVKGPVRKSHRSGFSMISLFLRTIFLETFSSNKSIFTCSQQVVRIHRWHKQLDSRWSWRCRWWMKCQDSAPVSWSRCQEKYFEEQLNLFFLLAWWHHYHSIIPVTRWCNYSQNKLTLLLIHCFTNFLHIALLYLLHFSSSIQIFGLKRKKIYFMTRVFFNLWG